jgi:signal transduction histidine kinase
MGLATMKERVDRVGGSLDIYSQPGAGTVITAHLPWEGKKAELAGTVTSG